MKNIFYTLYMLFLFFPSVLTAQTSPLRIEGKIKGDYEGQTVRLDVLKKGGFPETFFGTVKENTFFIDVPECNTCDTLAKLQIGNNPDKEIPVWLDGAHISLDTDMEKTRIAGTKLNDLYQQYSDTVEYHKGKIAPLSEEEQTSKQNERSKIGEMTLDLGNFQYDFLKENIRNPIGIYLYKEQLGRSIPVALHRLSDFLDIFNSADERIKSDPNSILKKKDIEDMIAKYYAKLEKQSTPAKDFDVVYVDKKNDKLLNILANSKSEYFLLEFWASWCGPCIAALPALRDIYEKYNDKGLEIISVSIDDDPTAWKEKLRQLKTPWINLLFDSNKTEKSKLHKDYSFTGVPCIILLDKSGKIVSYLGANKKYLDAKLSELLLANK